MSTTIAVHPQASGASGERGGWVGPTVGICMTVACAVLFNVFPEKVGYYRTIADPTSFVPLLGCGFADFLPWLNLWWALAFSLNVAHFAVGRWTIVTRAGHLALDVLGATILLAMAGGQPFVQVPVVTAAIRLGLTVTGCALLLDALGEAVRLLRRLAASA
jgi:hypothetical protein